MRYSVVEEISPYKNSFIFNIFSYTDTINLQNPNLKIFVILLKSDKNLKIKDKIVVYVRENNLTDKTNLYNVIFDVLSCELINFDDYEFSADDILISAPVQAER